MANNHIDPELLKSLLHYDPETGFLFWKHRPRHLFKADGDMKKWNTKYAGKRALNAVHSEGYLYGPIFAKQHRAHRVAWAISYGEWPDNIDHINRVRTDNRLSNLRNVSLAENNRNLPMRKNNTSGVTGVSWSNLHNRWVAQICVDKRVTYLGLFDTIEEAAAARAAANVKYGFHENHGREAR